MDSFYDAPRRAPMPTQVEKFLSTPVVPEVSIICSSKTNMNKNSSYNSWRMQQNRTDNANHLISDNSKTLKDSQKFPQNQCLNSQNTSQFMKKQVRFESPVLQQRPLPYVKLNTMQIVPENHTTHLGSPITNCEQPYTSNHNNIPLNKIPFEQMYLSNIPNRHLDLSLIDVQSKSNKGIEKGSANKSETAKTNLQSGDLQKTNEKIKEISENKENMLPKTYKEFLETQKHMEKENLNDSVTDIFNYKRKPFTTENREIKKGGGCIIGSDSTNPVERINTSTTNNRNCNVNKNFSPRFQLEKQISSPINSHDYKPQDFLSNHKEFYYSLKCDKSTQTTTTESNDIIKQEDEPTDKNLLKIIAQQNEQLLILQKQLAMLLNREDQRQVKQVDDSHSCQKINYLEEKCITSTQNENFRKPVQDNTPRKQRPLSKFSIDLMTSFEVAIRPQHKQNFVNHEPKIQEITESDNGIPDNALSVDKCDKTLGDTSLHLQEPVKVREMCPSPEPSININMNDYDSSDDEVSASEIGATFYRNLMNQVNDILRKAQIQTKDDFKDSPKHVDHFKNQTMNRVKEATLKHLKNIGVTIGPSEETDEISSSNDNQGYNPTEVSFAVKQLLMKYLPDEQLAKITYKQAQSVPYRKTENPGIITMKPEFSFASLQYMKKYNLLSNKDTTPRKTEQVPKVFNCPKTDGQKILDITALKMQPKLL